MTTKASPWYSTSRANRRRKPIDVTLSDDERAQLERLAEQHKVKPSRVVSAAVAELAALAPSKAARAIREAAERDAAEREAVAAWSPPRRRRRA